MKSYNDSNPLFAIQKAYHEPTRSLLFHSTEIESDRLQEALDLIGDYNEFNSKKVGKVLLDVFGDRCKYIVGREYSVVVYVIPMMTNFHFWVNDMAEVKEKGVIDEVAVVNGRLRMWWD